MTSLSTPPEATTADPRRWKALVVIAIAQLMVVLDGSIVNIALPSIQVDLGFSDADRQWVVTAYTLAFGGLLLLGGRIAKPYRYMSGATEFNGDLFAAEHLCISDEAPGRDIHSRRSLGSHIKSMLFDIDQSCHPKNRQAITLRPIWAMSISLNDEPENHQVLPPLEALAHKVPLGQALGVADHDRAPDVVDRRLQRAFGFGNTGDFDPFLLFDDFRNDRPEDYLAGFPWHPHRRIETLTYVLAGQVDHADSLGNAGELGAVASPYRDIVSARPVGMPGGGAGGRVPRR